MRTEVGHEIIVTGIVVSCRDEQEEPSSIIVIIVLGCEKNSIPLMNKLWMVVWLHWAGLVAQFPAPGHILQ